MNVVRIQMVVLSYAQTPLGPTHAAATLGTGLLLMDIPAMVYYASVTNRQCMSM